MSNNDCVLVTSPVLRNLLAQTNPTNVFSLHMDEHDQGQGAYYIFNNTHSEKETELAGDHKRSVAHIQDNPQLSPLKNVLHLALRICQKMGLCSNQHDLHVPVTSLKLGLELLSCLYVGYISVRGGMQTTGSALRFSARRYCRNKNTSTVLAGVFTE